MTSNNLQCEMDFHGRGAYILLLRLPRVVDAF